MSDLIMIFTMLAINGVICIVPMWFFYEKWSEIFGIGSMLTIGMTLFTALLAQVFISYVIFLISAAIFSFVLAGITGNADTKISTNINRKKELV